MGYSGKLLYIDLSKERSIVKELDEGLWRRFIGGKGVGAKILSDELKPETHPLSPDNPLIFTTGPVNGYLLPGGARFHLVFRSPLTGIFGESNCGGYFAAHMKYAGFDGIIVKGRSDKPVYALIEDEDIKLLDATHLVGLDAFETEETLLRDHGKKFQVLCIGPAGEKLVKFSCINHRQGRQFGRCGAGAVMGSKNLKAIALRGSGEVEWFDREGLEEFRRELVEEALERLKSLREYGTPGMMALTNTTGTLPTRYWSEGEFEGVKMINGEAMKEQIVERNNPCYGCPVACGKISVVKEGPYRGVEVEGPEYETLYAFGSLCSIDDLGFIAKANEVCDRLGLDTITAGNVVAFTMDLFERGILTREDLDGVEIRFGSPSHILDLLRKIAYREGIGGILAEGVKGAAEGIGRGAPDLAVHVKGLEPAGYDPRGLKGVALAYAVSCRGACHLRHLAYRPNLTGSHPFRDGEVDRLSYKGQAELVKEEEDFYAIVDSMVLCKFVCLPSIGPILWDKLIELYRLLTGFETDLADMMEKGIEINNTIRSLNLRMGMEREDDTIPLKFMASPLKKGASKGETVPKEKFEEMLKDYYRLRGWS